jgi:hypothetical protein
VIAHGFGVLMFAAFTLLAVHAGLFFHTHGGLLAGNPKEES